MHLVVIYYKNRTASTNNIQKRTGTHFWRNDSTDESTIKLHMQHHNLYMSIVKKKTIQYSPSKSNANSPNMHIFFSFGATATTLRHYMSPMHAPSLLAFCLAHASVNIFLLVDTASITCPVPTSNQPNRWLPRAMPLLDEPFGQQAAASAYAV